MLKNLFKTIKNNPKEFLFYCLVFLLFIINAGYVSYPDEFVNLLGGQSINKGLIPYKDFFDHHMPGAWYLSSIIMLFTSKSYVAFRYVYSILTFVSFLILGIWIKNNHKDIFKPYLGFFLFYPIMGVFFWFHLFLADSLGILFFSLIFWLLFITSYEKKYSFKLINLISLLNFVLIFSSMTYVYIGIFFYLWIGYLVLKNKSFKELTKIIGFSLIPYIIYGVYLLITGSISGFIYSNFTYNTKLYIDIPNYTKGAHFNPIKFAMTIIFNFWETYLPLLTRIKHLDLFMPIGTLCGLSTITLLTYLIFKNFPIAIFYFLILSFSAPRSNFNSFSETNYQISVFLGLGIISTFINIYLFSKEKFENKLIDDLKRITSFIILIFTFFSFLFLIYNTYSKYYQRYTQKMPGIYNIHYSADFINEILNEKDYYFIGPYEPQEIFYVNNRFLPGKFVSLLPGFRNDKNTKKDFLLGFEKNSPKIIIYKKDASIFMTPSIEFGKFFLDWTKNKYIPLEEIKDIKVIKSPSTFNLKTDLLIRKENLIEILKILKEKKYIENI